jgi:putative OPT family oligopeptide transporter
MDAATESKSLPENAYRPLKPGETYAPYVPAGAALPEATPRAVIWGAVLTALFTMASAYSGLKVGQVMEAAIPISILAIGLGRAYPRRSSPLENVVITGIGGMSGAVVAGAIFTLPALYILKLDPHPWQTTFICLAGGALGVLFLIPLRRYFVRETHGEFPFPEATAITEVLVTGEKGGSQAKLLLQATGIAAVYDFAVTTFKVWREVIDFRFVPAVNELSQKAKMTLSFDALGLILGLGYVMGLRSSMILVAGGVLSNLVLVPLIWFVGRQVPDAVYPATVPISEMDAGLIFSRYVRLVGVGAIATAGIFGIVKSLPVIASSFGIAVKAFRSGGEAHLERTDRDVSVMTILIGVVVSTLAVAIFIGTLDGGPGTTRPSLGVTAIGLALTLLFSFFFTTVAANAIATTARNPVSGMTMLTIMISAVVLLQFGLSGRTGMFFVMAMAGMVCTALSVSGQAITDLKTGYWLGSTPREQERWKFLGVLVAAVFSALTVYALTFRYQFGEAAPGDPRPVLDAPQAAIMKTLVENFMSQQPIAYMLLAVGAFIAIVLEMLKVPALTFALGMYLPLYLNTPALVGGVLHHYVTRRGDRTGGGPGQAIRERGVIIASGLMAGGALGGVFGAALLSIPGVPATGFDYPIFASDALSQSLSALAFLALCAYLWFGSVRKARAA